MSVSSAGESTRTPQERGDALRIAADHIEESGGFRPDTIRALRLEAQRLDPPRPQYEAGSWALVTHPGGTQAMVRRPFEAWGETPDPDSAQVFDKLVMDVEPLPILPAGHVALINGGTSSKSWRAYAKVLRDALPTTENNILACNALMNCAVLAERMADALDAADRARQQGQPTSTGGEG